ncbi:MAG: lipopolysaccharide heptosyltransferase II [Gammaproteobacteria bacterium]|nr:lipopolysaccharide heptosyltransferase II [Gammaproteobacteria bacterium]MDD9896843.1 lipopolysaccharide heptosyltransferase II [Gammaproteobacteria bacterium]MDD9958483.1 lipopolysaccharide heptosyltransferase II [Gammaproteobacteria bacterium]
MLPALQSVDSLVVRCPNWVGDVVMATPVFECLRHNFPQATITALIRPYARGILEDSPWFDHIVDCQDKNLKGLAAIRKSFSAIKPQMGLLLPNTTHSWLTFKYAGVPQIYGYRRNIRKHFLHGPDPIRKDGKFKPMPMQDYYLELCRFLELDLPEKVKPSLYVSDSVQQRGNERLEKYGIKENDLVIGLNPGASFGSSKCWPAEHFGSLTELLYEKYRCKFLLLAGPGEEDIAAAIVAASAVNIINTAGDKIDLAALKPLVKRCNLLVTNDTGPRHYAVAFNVPHIVLMGPTNPAYTQSNLEHSVVLQKDLPCIPCHKKSCPLGHHACMRELMPGAVFNSCVAKLAETNS